MKHRPRPGRVSKRPRKDRWASTEEAAVRVRAGDHCELSIARNCTGQGVHFHHRHPHRLGGRDTRLNLLLVCWPCHHTVHANETRAFAKGWMLRQAPEIAARDYPATSGHQW